MVKGLICYVICLSYRLKSLIFTVKGLTFRLNDLIIIVKYKVFTHFEVSLRNTEAKWKESVFPFISPKSPPWKMRKTKHELVTPFFFRNWGLKPQIFEISLAPKMIVKWFCFFIYLYHINHPLENGNHETCMSQQLFSRKMRFKYQKQSNFSLKRQLRT